jgi:2-haloacid dehalogenase
VDRLRRTPGRHGNYSYQRDHDLHVFGNDLSEIEVFQMIRAVIFDLGGVLIDWNPRYLFHDTYFPTIDQRQHFLEKICTMEWNETQDAGYPIRQAVEEKVKEFPDWEPAIRDYYDRWNIMLKGEISGTVKILEELKNKKQVKLYALTNWSAELFPVALERYPFLQWFDGRVVSGEEKMRKPFPEIYERVLTRYQLKPEETLFIDDSLRNVLAAEQMGIRSIQFHSPEQLRKALKEQKLL